MFRIRHIPDDLTRDDAEAMRQAAEILRAQFPEARPAEFDEMSALLRNPFAKRLRPIFLVAEDGRGKVKGVATVLHAPDIAFCYLDYLAAGPGRSGSGIGAALYQRVRDIAIGLNAFGLFLEATSDDPALAADPEVLKRRRARLQFYERFGARPIIGTKYEAPVRPGGAAGPPLLFDGLDRTPALSRQLLRNVVGAILRRKYADICPPGYAAMVVRSIVDDPVRLREPRYVRRDPARVVWPAAERRIVLVVNDKHDIHHVRDRGYVEAPARISAILSELDREAPFERIAPRRFSRSHVTAVHDSDLVKYIRAACLSVPAKQSIYPYVFPVRNRAHPPKSLALRAGYFCIDTFTPLNRNAWLAARRAVDCTLTAAERLAQGSRLAYALVRPPGHHAERDAFGGFCYLNNAAIAANYLSARGAVAVLDIDYHHGNGTQDIFWTRKDVLTVSVHGHPRDSYPYFSGFRTEIGEGKGKGFNLNLPQPEGITPKRFLEVLDAALARIRRFKPAYLVLSLGFDTAAGDPTGSWSNRPPDFLEIGRRIGAAGYRTLVVQEGGYRTRTLGTSARSFFAGLWAGAAASRVEDAALPRRVSRVVARSSVPRREPATRAGS